MTSNVEAVFEVENIVGESIVWDDRENRLYWVDIVGRKIHSLDPESGDHRSWPTPDIVTSIGLDRNGGAIVGLSKSIARWHFTDAFDIFAEIEEDDPETRLNEGVVGPDGAFWVGTMQNNINPDGSPKEITRAAGRIYRVTADGSVTRLSDDHFGITNTLVWPQTGGLITADTLENAFYAYSYDADTGRLFDRQVLLLGFERGLPDGSCIDAEGFVWNCRVASGHSLIRFDSLGRIDRVVELPCASPTSCAFGGESLDTLFVTSSRFGMDSSQLAAPPLEGGLFALQLGVRGVPPYRFG